MTPFLPAGAGNLLPYGVRAAHALGQSAQMPIPPQYLRAFPGAHGPRRS